MRLGTLLLSALFSSAVFAQTDIDLRWQINENGGLYLTYETLDGTRRVVPFDTLSGAIDNPPVDPDPDPVDPDPVDPDPVDPDPDPIVVDPIDPTASNDEIRITLLVDDSANIGDTAPAEQSDLVRMGVALSPEQQKIFDLSRLALGVETIENDEVVFTAQPATYSVIKTNADGYPEWISVTTPATVKNGEPAKFILRQNLDFETPTFSPFATLEDNTATIRMGDNVAKADYRGLVHLNGLDLTSSGPFIVDRFDRLYSAYAPTATVSLTINDGLMAEVLIEGDLRHATTPDATFAQYTLKLRFGYKTDIRGTLIIRNATENSNFISYKQAGIKLPKPISAVNFTVHDSATGETQDFEIEPPFKASQLVNWRPFGTPHRSDPSRQDGGWTVSNLIQCYTVAPYIPIGTCSGSTEKWEDKDYGFEITGATPDDYSRIQYGNIASGFMTNFSTNSASIALRDMPVKPTQGIEVTDTETIVYAMDTRSAFTQLHDYSWELVDFYVDLNPTNAKYAWHQAQNPLYGFMSLDQLNASGVWQNVQVMPYDEMMGWFKERYGKTNAALAYEANKPDYNKEPYVHNRRNYDSFEEDFYFASLREDGAHANIWYGGMIDTAMSIMPMSDGFDMSQSTVKPSGVSQTQRTDVTHSEAMGILMWPLFSGGDVIAWRVARDTSEYLLRAHQLNSQPYWVGARAFYQRMMQVAYTYRLLGDDRHIEPFIAQMMKWWEGVDAPIDVDNHVAGGVSHFNFLGYYKHRGIWLTDRFNGDHVFFRWDYGGEALYPILAALKQYGDEKVLRRVELMFEGVARQLLDEYPHVFPSWGVEFASDWGHAAGAQNKLRLKAGYSPNAWMHYLTYDVGVDGLALAEYSHYGRLTSYQYRRNASQNRFMYYTTAMMERSPYTVVVEGGIPRKSYLPREDGDLLPIPEDLGWQTVAHTIDDGDITFDVMPGYEHRVLAAPTEIVDSLLYNPVAKEYTYDPSAYTPRFGAEPLVGAESGRVPTEPEYSFYRVERRKL